MQLAHRFWLWAPTKSAFSSGCHGPICPGKPAAFWPNLWAWSTGPPHFAPLSDTTPGPAHFGGDLAQGRNLVNRASSPCTSECHGPPDATVLRRWDSSESLFTPSAKKETLLPNGLWRLRLIWAVLLAIFIGPMSDHWVALSVIKSLMLGDFINVSLANKNAYLKAVNVTAHVENDV